MTPEQEMEMLRTRIDGLRQELQNAEIGREHLVHEKLSAQMMDACERLEILKGRIRGLSDENTETESVQ